MSEWRAAFLGSLVDNFDNFRKPVRSVDRVGGQYPYYGASGIVDHVNEYLFDGEYLLVSEDGENLRSRSTPIAFLARGQFWVNNHAHVLRGNALADTRFLAHALAVTDINGHITGSTQPKLSRTSLDQIVIAIPAVLEQRAIAEVLGALDDKIAANTKLLDTIRRHQVASMKVALTGEIRRVRVDDVAQFHNKRRIPLSAPEREARVGSVPYYGASGVFGFVDEALFDEPLLLVGEDGSVIRDDGTPVTQYVWGPAWVNNHAHVLKGKDVSTEVLFIAVSGAQVNELVTGAVQPKISMGNLRRLELELPVGEELVVLEAMVAAEMASARVANDENRTLADIRDTLLPQLMSGKLRVRDAERTVGEVL